MDVVGFYMYAREVQVPNRVREFIAEPIDIARDPMKTVLMKGSHEKILGR